MARSRKVTGTCHLCGNYGPLSFEHVPPRAAFNDRPVVRYRAEEVFNLGPDDKPAGGGTIQQKGSGAYTLCGRCNNVTGSWYGRHFVDWCWQGMHILARSGGSPSLIYLHYVFPLSIIKQIFTMFFSLHSERYREKHEEIVRFLLNREAKYLPPNYRVFVYFMGEGRPRFSGTSALLNLGAGQMQLMAELAFPPFGYLLTYGGPPPDERLFEITHFARYSYEEFAVMELRLPVLPTYLHFPGDYRTREQIHRDRDENMRFEPHDV